MTNGDCKQLLSRISRVGSLAWGLFGAAFALMLLPALLLPWHLPHQDFVLAVCYACSLWIISVVSLVAVLGRRWHLQREQWWEEAVSRRHDEVLVRVKDLEDQVAGFEARLHDSCQRLTRLVEANGDKIRLREEEHDQEVWNARSDGVAAALGGRDVVEGIGTRDIVAAPRPLRAVVPMRNDCGG